MYFYFIGPHVCKNVNRFIYKELTYIIVFNIYLYVSTSCSQSCPIQVSHALQVIAQKKNHGLGRACHTWYLWALNEQ